MEEYLEQYVILWLDAPPESHWWEDERYVTGYAGGFTYSDSLSAARRFATINDALAFLQSSVRGGGSWDSGLTLGKIRIRQVETVEFVGEVV